MCCDGVMFHTVRLQPSDMPKELAGLGIRLKRKHGHRCILQPCPAYREAQCSIYAQRPERCRVFECRQLRGVAAGEITEAAALARIRDAREQVGKLNALLERAGQDNLRRPLSKRCAEVLEAPLDEANGLRVAEVREMLGKMWTEFEALLDGHFRVDAAADVPG